jgi:serine acetyltransferase
MFIFQDWKANAGNPKGMLVMALFRIAHALRFGPKWLLPLTVIYGIFYRVLVEWILCIELPWKTKVGPGLGVYHGFSTVISDKAIIGKDCIVRHSVTIARKYNIDGSRTAAPVLGDRVNIMPHAMILGPIIIGSDSIIGAGAVVIKDVPAGALVAGNPARILKFISNQKNTASSSNHGCD